MTTLINDRIDLTGVHLEMQLERLGQEGLSRAKVNGAVLFQGLSMETDDHLCRYAKALLPSIRPYEGGLGYKRSVDGYVFTSTEQPGFVTLTPHSELSYVPNPPRWIAFFCREAATKGGATTLVDAQAVVRALPEALVRDFHERGVCYERTYPNERPWMKALNRRVRLLVSWQQAFQTTDANRVSETCERLGIQYRWDDKKGLSITNTLPGVTQHPRLEQMTWTNQAHTFLMTPYNVGLLTWLAVSMVYWFPTFRQTHATFGDGSPIPNGHIDQVTKAVRALQEPYNWKPGDALLLDNWAILHGRLPFSGSRALFTATGS